MDGFGLYLNSGKHREGKNMITESSRVCESPEMA